MTCPTCHSRLWQDVGGQCEEEEKMRSVDLWVGWGVLVVIGIILLLIGETQSAITAGR